MKKFSYFLLGAAALTLASCSSEDVAAPGAADGNFTVKVQLPADLATRATVTPADDEYGQGYTANVLQYAVYEVNAQGNLIKYVTEGETTFPDGSLKTEVSLTLANGKYYALAFFAQSNYAKTQNVYQLLTAPLTGSPYLQVNYDNMENGTNAIDGYDCFYRLYDTGQVGGPTTNSSPTVYLYRPVAQINWGTNDYHQVAVTDANAFGTNPVTTLQTYFSGEVYTQMDLFTSDVIDGSEKEVTFAAMNVPNINYNAAFPVKDYSYLAMQYVLAPGVPDDEGSNQTDGGYLYDLNLNVQSTVSSHNIDIAVPNCPVQANWRTNIYGSLLTDNFTVYVEKVPVFDGEFNVAQWDGKTLTEPSVVDGVAQVNGPSELAYIAQNIADYTDTDIELNATLDFANHVVTPLGTEENPYNGTFNGNGNTVKGFIVNGETGKPSGFFGVVGEGGSVENVVFDNVNINGGASTAGINAAVGVIGECAGTVDNVTVNGTVTGTNDVAGVVGHLLEGGKINNSTNNATINGNWNVGGVAGESSGDVTGCVNNGGVSANGNSIGGIVAEQDSQGTISGCQNNGDVKGSSEAFGVGGIVGWVRYFSSKAEIGTVTVTNCKNYGNVEGGYAAGIVGRWALGGVCTNNENYAGAVKGTYVEAGIVTVSTDQNYTSVPDAPKDLVITGNTSTTADLPVYAGTTPATIDASGNTPAN